MPIPVSGGVQLRRPNCRLWVVLECVRTQERRPSLCQGECNFAGRIVVVEWGSAHPKKGECPSHSVSIQRGSLGYSLFGGPRVADLTLPPGVEPGATGSGRDRSWGSVSARCGPTSGLRTT